MGPVPRRRPDTSKWNKIDHRTWATTTKTGLNIRAAYHLNWYPKGVRITDSEFAAALPIDRRGWRRDWNYTSAPRSLGRLGSVR